MAEEQHEELKEVEEQEQRIREKSEDDSLAEAVEDEMRKDMEEQSPGEAIKRDMKALKQDVQETVTSDDEESDS